MSRLDQLRETRSKINAEIDFLQRNGEESAQFATTAAPVDMREVRGAETGLGGGFLGREKTAEEIVADLFTYHPVPDEATAVKYETVRDAAKHLAMVIWKACPYGPDRTAAIRKVREAVMTANAAIALNGRSI